MRACPLVQQNKAAYCKQKAEKQRVPDGAKGCQMMQKGARGYQMVPVCATCTRGCQLVPVGAKGARLGRSWPQDWVKRPI